MRAKPRHPPFHPTPPPPRVPPPEQLRLARTLLGEAHKALALGPEHASPSFWRLFDAAGLLADALQLDRKTFGLGRPTDRGYQLHRTRAPCRRPTGSASASLSPTPPAIVTAPASRAEPE